MSKEEIQDLKTEIKKLKDEKEKLETQDEDEEYEEYDEMLDETKTEWIDKYEGSEILKEVDPIAYRCGLIDFKDGRLSEIEAEIAEKEEEILVFEGKV